MSSNYRQAFRFAHLHWLLIPLSVGVCAAVYDTISHISPLPVRFENFSAALLPPGWFLIKFLTAYVPAALFLIIGLGLLYPVPARAVAGTLSLCIASALLFGPNLSDPKGIAIAAFFLSLFIGAGNALERLCKDGQGRRLVHRLCLTLLGGASVFFCLTWVIEFGLRDLFRGQTLMVRMVYLLCAALCMLPLLRLQMRGRKQAYLAVAVGVVFALPLFWTSSEHAVEPTTKDVGDVDPPRIILIVADTLRADALSCLNPDAGPTPAIDGLSREGVLFEKAIAPAPWTFPSMNSMMTGMLPYVDARTLAYDTVPLPTVASLLAEDGYRTRGFSGNDLLYRPLHVTDGLHEMDTFSHWPYGDSVGSGFSTRWPRRFLQGGSTSELTRQGLRWVKDHRDKPFFLWMHYMDPHDPYAPPSTFIGHHVQEPHYWMPSDGELANRKDRERTKALYDAEVRYLDTQVGELLEGLKRLDLYDDSLFVFTSDHGEEFWEHNGFYHGRSLYQEVLHVPLIIRLPRSQTVHRVTSYVPMRAIIPTILDLASVDSPRPQEWAKSLVPLFSGSPSTKDEGPIVSTGTMSTEFQRSVILRGFKYIRWVESGNEELYDLENDPGETRSVVSDYPEILHETRSVLAEYELYASRMRQHIAIDPDSGTKEEIQRRLKSLGYIN